MSLPISFFERPVERVARDLVGCRLVSDVEEERVAGRIVETEAYGMDEEAFFGRHVRLTESGEVRTSPTGAVLLGARGAAFIYSVFFGNWLLNVVAGPPGYLGCVLIRAVEPLEGVDHMRRRTQSTSRVDRLAAGPGRLTRAFAINGSLNGHDLRKPPLVLYPKSAGVEPRLAVGPRALNEAHAPDARELPWRFVDAGSPSLSRPARRVADRWRSP
ncbi:MAG TPA: DNA-3-methyladenine glycosylase [Rhodothermales bacterium]|nr:DNA-3-methyladenine glycosylase [Rhodothermales bacterium]